MAKRQEATATLQRTKEQAKTKEIEKETLRVQAAEKYATASTATGSGCALATPRKRTAYAGTNSAPCGFPTAASSLASGYTGRAIQVSNHL